MSSMIVSDNRIKTRRYNLLIDGKIVEEMLSPRMAKILANEYRMEGFAVDKIEVFSVTNGVEIVGENPVISGPESNPRKKFLTPSATDLKVKKDRIRNRTKNALLEAKRNKESKSVRYTSYGRERNSLLHQDYLNNIRKYGYRVHNLLTDEVWFGVRTEIAERIWNYLNTGGKKSDLDIKYIGSE